MNRDTIRASGFIIDIIFFMFNMVTLAENDVTIRGIVRDATTNEPLVNANIIIEGTTRGAASDTAGRFIINDLPFGYYKLKASYMGYEPDFQHLYVTTSQPRDVEFMLRESFFQGEQVVVTATRTKKLMENVPVVTELITKSEIRETGAENLSQVLEDRPGITIEENVNGGKTLSMGGIDGKYILILVDGTPLAGKFNNRMELNLIDVDQIEQVEIVKGPSSALYGSEAMGGVINIITKGFEEKLRISANGKAGSNELYSGGFNVSGSNRDLGYALNVNHSQGGIDQNEVSITVSDTRTTVGDAKVSLENETIGKLDAGVTLQEDVQNGEDTVFFTETTVNRWNAHLDWARGLSKRFSLKTKAYLSDYRRTYAETVIHSGYLARIDSTEEDVIGLKSDLSYQLCSYSRMDIGIDYTHNRFESQRVINKGITRKQTGVFFQSESNFYDKFTLIVGGRYDKITDIEGYLSPRVSGMWTISPQLKMRASYGGGFRAPSFTDMYIDYDNVFVGYRVEGNPNLKPERALGGNIGIEYFWDYTVLFNATVFQNKFRDMILDYSVRPGVFSYTNIDHATFRGFELQTKYYLMKNLTANLAYNYTWIKQSKVRNEVTNISPHTASLKLNYAFLTAFRLSLREQFYSESKVRELDRRLGQYTDNIVTKSGYHVLDATLTWNLGYHLDSWMNPRGQNQFRDMFSMRFGVNNILDYTNIEFGPWIGRRFFVALDINY